jgi:hypothetical protein
MRRGHVALLLVLTACTGNDPTFVGTDPADAGPDGAPADGGDGGTATPFLQLEGQPLTLVAGTNDVLQIKVIERRNLGEVSFKVKGIPEGISAPSIVTLPAAATAINIPLTSTASMRHGDFVVTIEAEGQPFQASAKLVVRGAPGSKDTGFGTDGSALIARTAGNLFVAGLADDRVVFGNTSLGKPSLTILDAKGAVGPQVTTIQTGTLIDLAPTADGGFVTLVSGSGQLRIVWYSKAGVEATPNLVVSTATVPLAKIASTPMGVFFAQARTSGALAVGRYVGGAEVLPPVSLTGSETSLRFLAGASDGSAWIGMQSGISQEQLARVTPNQAPVLKPLVPTESCGTGGSLGNDLVVYCMNDTPSYTLRRYTPTGALAPSFGTGGALPIDGTNLHAILGHGTDRLYVAAHATATPNTRRVTAYDGKGAVRTVFGVNGVLGVLGADDRPVVALDARGRLLFASSETSTGANVRVSRFWD